MNTIGIFLACKYDPSRDHGAFGYCINDSGNVIKGNGTFVNTSGARCELIGCIEALNFIERTYRLSPIIQIYSKQPAIIESMVRGRTKKSKPNPNQDLYDKGKVACMRFKIKVYEWNQLKTNSLYLTEKWGKQNHTVLTKIFLGADLD